jgi:hypothetical protein
MKILDSALYAAIGSAIGCFAGIGWALYNPAQDWTVVAGFAAGTVLGACVPFMLRPAVEEETERTPSPEPVYRPI